MSVLYDDSRVWANIDTILKDDLILKIISSLECLVCSEVMHVPFLLPCGHTFCYGCLNAWFENKINCPTCRCELPSLPTLNIQLKEISNNITETVVDSLEDNVHRNNLKQAKQAVLDEYEEAKPNLFGDAFKTTLTIIDNSDGVPRCSNCHWEAHGSQCLQCGARFRTARNDLYYDSDDGDAYNEDDEEDLEGETGNIEGIADAYDSEDSFVDSRGLDDINRDQDSYSDDGLLSSNDERGSDNGARDDESRGLWGGFDESDYGGGRNYSALEEMEDTVDRLHQQDVEDYFDDSNDVQSVDGLSPSHVTGDSDEDMTLKPSSRRRNHAIVVDLELDLDDNSD